MRVFFTFIRSISSRTKKKIKFLQKKQNVKCWMKFNLNKLWFIFFFLVFILHSWYYHIHYHIAKWERENESTNFHTMKSRWIAYACPRSRRSVLCSEYFRLAKKKSNSTCLRLWIRLHIRCERKKVFIVCFRFWLFFMWILFIFFSKAE